MLSSLAGAIIPAIYFTLLREAQYRRFISRKAGLGIKNPAEAIPQAGLFARTEEGETMASGRLFFEQPVDRSCFKTIDDPTRSSDREVLALMSD
jgi:hypothetical protein